MTTSELLTALSDRGIQLWVEGDQLRYRAPKEALTTALRDSLVKNKKEVVELLSKEAGNSELTYPLSYNQQALWFTNQAAPNSPAYHIAFSARIRSEVDIPALKYVFQALVDRHPTLRTSYSDDEGGLIQRVHGRREVCLTEVDGSFWSEGELKEKVIEAYQRPFDLSQAPLIRFYLFHCSQKDHVLLMVVHHIAVDGWSLWILLDEIRSLYSSRLAGTPASLTIPKIKYTDYVTWQAEMLGGPQGERLWAYWKKQLDGELTPLNLPGYQWKTTMQAIDGASLMFTINEDLTGKVKSFSRAEGVTLYTVLLAAYYILLYRYTGKEDILVSSPVSGRSRPEFEGIVGCFINPVVFRARINGGMRFREFLKETQRTILGGLEHQDYPLALLTQQLQQAGDLGLSPLFQVDFVLQQAQRSDDISSILGAGTEVRSVNFGGLELEPYYIPSQEGQLDLTLEMAEGNGLLWACLKYNTTQFDVPAAERMSRHFRTLLESILADPAQTISALKMLCDAELHQLTVKWNETGSDPDHRVSRDDLRVHQLFEREAERVPFATAVVSNGDQMTYRELNERSNQLAHYLIENGVAPETIVGVCLDRSCELIIAVLAVLKAGGAFLPLDPAHPKERLRFMLEDSGASLLLTQEGVTESLQPCQARIICLDAIDQEIKRENNGNPPPVATPSNLVYVIYTSGSTGQAKGVMIEHRSLTNAYLSWEEAYQLNSLKSHFQMANCAFDVFTGDLVRALCSGARLVLCPREYLMDPPNLYRLMLREEVDFAEFVPAVLRELANYLRNEGQKLDFLKLLVCGSDNWSMDEYRRFKELCGVNTRLINSYGVTEATIDSTYFEGEFKDLPSARLVPIGRPFENTKLYILDTNLQPVPIGVSGELHIGGAGLARGYLNRPELTAEKFIADTFGNDPKARLYKTGDLARYLTDGNAELLGRVDFQVKIRGLRVETGEIESLLGQHPGVEQSAVTAIDDALGNKRLVGYVVVRSSQSAPSSNDIRTFLKKKLPEYMVPSTFLVMERFPLTPSGKVDRQALPSPNDLNFELGGEYAAPRSETEKKVSAVWQEVLNLEKVSIHHDFFELGGHSLLATRVMSRINQLFDIHLPLRNLFEATTIATLADLIDTLLWTSGQGIATSQTAEREIIEI